MLNGVSFGSQFGGKAVKKNLTERMFGLFWTEGSDDNATFGISYGHVCWLICIPNVCRCRGLRRYHRVLCQGIALLDLTIVLRFGVFEVVMFWVS